MTKQIFSKFSFGNELSQEERDSICKAVLKAADKHFVRYQKYKRCLVMAGWCDAEMYAYPSFGTERPKEKWWKKWHKRWLKIAEKFKEA